MSHDETTELDPDSNGDDTETSTDEEINEETSDDPAVTGEIDGD